MKVSIVIPVYNGEKYLKESIDSALSQSYSNIEVIAVNDGSTDSSLQILKDYGDQIKLISKENGGVSSAINAGVKQMTGEWLKIQGHDDVMYPDAIEILVSVGQEIKDKKHSILYANFDFIDSQGKIFAHMEEPNYNHLDNFNFNVIMLDHHFGNTNTSLIHKSTLDEFGYFNEKVNFEDYEFWLRNCLLHGCRLVLIQKTIGKYRIHSNQLTKTNMKWGKQYRDDLKKTILGQLSDSERKKYEIGLINYRKNKPIVAKAKFFFRYSLLPAFPLSFSNKIINAYWHMQKQKHS